MYFCIYFEIDFFHIDFDIDFIPDLCENSQRRFFMKKPFIRTVLYILECIEKLLIQCQKILHHLK
jgi:hypothetical protein